MEPKKRRALEVAGWQVGDAAEFLGLSAAERQLVDARVEAARAVRVLRDLHGLSQHDLAAKLKTSQPRVVKIERADKDVSLDQILRAYSAAGGTFRIAFDKIARNRKRPAVAAKKRRNPVA